LSHIAGQEGALVKIHANASLYAGLFDGPEKFTLALQPDRKAYVHLVRGELQVNGHMLQSGDAAMLDKEAQVLLSNGIDAEVLVFDLAP
jgi:redox-sensitive bicupin YhaK (pirin superfamily)